MELALQGLPIKLYKAQDKAKTVSNKSGIGSEMRQCVEEIKRNEALYNLEYEPELIDACIYERQALLARYHFLLRTAKQSLA